MRTQTKKDSPDHQYFIDKYQNFEKKKKCKPSGTAPLCSPSTFTGRLVNLPNFGSTDAEFLPIKSIHIWRK